MIDTQNIYAALILNADFSGSWFDSRPWKRTKPPTAPCFRRKRDSVETELESESDWMYRHQVPPLSTDAPLTLPVQSPDVVPAAAASPFKASLYLHRDVPPSHHGRNRKGRRRQVEPNATSERFKEEKTTKTKKQTGCERRRSSW